jgi:hypothetical protein
MFVPLFMGEKVAFFPGGRPWQSNGVFRDTLP